MDITISKIDDINYLISGSIDNSLIEQKLSQLKKEADNQQNENATKNIEQQAASAAFQDFIDEAIKDANIEPQSLEGQPALRKYEKKDDKIFIEVDLATTPQIDLSIEYKDIIPQYTKPQADKKALEEKLLEFTTSQAPFTPIAEPREVQNGDVTIIDFEGFVDGVAFEGGSAKKYNLKIGSNSFIPGFEEQLIGMQYGEERTINVTFPANYQSEDLAGKESQFVIKLHEIQEQIPVEADDAFAQSVLRDPNATLETLEQKLADQIITQDLSIMYDNDLKPKIVQGLLAKFEFTLPNNLVAQELDALVRHKYQSMSQEEQKELQENQQKYKDFRDSFMDEAKKNVKLSLIVKAIANKEGVKADEQEVIAALSYQAMMTGQNAQDLVKYYRDNNLMATALYGLLEDKLFGQMLNFHK